MLYMLRRFDDVRGESDGGFSAVCPGPGAPHRLRLWAAHENGSAGLGALCERCPPDALSAALGERLGPETLVTATTPAPPSSAAPVPRAAVARVPDRLTHIRDFLAEPDDAVSWIVDGLLPAGGMSVLAGKPKGGKSTLARAMALRVCRGEPILGRATTAGPVIYLGLEDPRRVTKNHLRTLGVRPDDDLYVFTGHRPDEAVVWLETVLATVDPVLAVVDTMQHLLGVSDLNDYARVVAALGPVLALVRPRRAHILLIHHAGKGDRTGFDAILGSTAIVGTVDVALLLKRGADNVRTLSSLQRTGEDLAERVVTLNDRQEPQLGPAKDAYDTQQAGERVLAWLRTQAEPVTRKAVEDAVEGKAEQVRKALYQLHEAAQVTRTGGGRRGDPYLFEIRVRVSRDTPGHADTNPETPGTSRNPATIACPADPGSGDHRDTIRDTNRGDADEPDGPADTSFDFPRDYRSRLQRRERTD